MAKKKRVIAGYSTQGDYTKVPPDDKLDILQFIQATPWPVKRGLEALDLAWSTFYDWRDRYRRDGFRGLVGLPRPPVIPESKLLESERAQIIATAKSLPLEVWVSSPTNFPAAYCHSPYTSTRLHM